MTRIRTLLAASDLSAPARHATERAAWLAKDLRSRLELVHVVSQGLLTELRGLLDPAAQAIEQRLLDQLRVELSQLAGDLAQRRGIEAGVHLATGPVLQEILSRAEAVDADLLVLGARGSGFMRHLPLGSTAERALRKTTRPLLVVKQAPHERYRRVLVPVDFSNWSLPALRLAQAVAPRGVVVPSMPSMCPSRASCAP